MLWIFLQTMQRISYFTNIQVLYFFLDNIWKICTYHTPYGDVTSAGWQVTLCDPMWHVSSHSGVATLRTAIHLLLTYLLTLTVTKLTTLTNSHFLAHPVYILQLQQSGLMHQCWCYCFCSLQKKYQIRIDTGDTFHVHSKKRNVDNDDDLMIAVIAVLSRIAFIGTW